jgi:hypothetical protein
MPPTAFSKLINPRFPSAALGIESASASVVQLERRRRDGFSLKRAATIILPSALVRPSFDERNITDANELADALAELVSSAGLDRQRKWSIALPETSARAVILTLDSAPASRVELEEVLRWKIERSFGHSMDELRVSREKISTDAQGRARYIAVGMHASVLDEYESVCTALGWRAGLILPRHVGEARWLTNSGKQLGDSLLVSSHAEGFTAVVVRNTHPLIVRSVMCEEEDRDDELYRLLLFYRDRLASPEDSPETYSIERLLVVGEGFDKEHVSEIINETLGLSLPVLRAQDVGLALPSGDLSFDSVAAPAGLASLAW